MDKRYPQPVLVGDLIGLPLLDYDDRTIGYVRSVVRTPDGKIQLIVTQGGWPTGWFNWRARLVPVPIEAVAILGRQIDLLDITREELAAAGDLVECRRHANSARRENPHRHRAPLS